MLRQTVCGCPRNPCEHSDNFWVSKLLSAFSNCSSPFPSTWKSPSFPALVPDICLSDPSSCLCLLTASSGLSLQQGYISMVCAAGMLWGRAGSLGSPAPVSKLRAALACSDGIMVAWLMGAVRSNVLCAEDRVFGGCCGQTLKPLIFYKLTKSRQSQEFIPKSNGNLPAKF